MTITDDVTLRPATADDMPAIRVDLPVQFMEKLPGA